MYMCVKFPPGDLNPDPCIYTCGVTTTPRIHSGLRAIVNKS